ncbi:MAG: kynureninase [Bacteroidetes bacterium]|nr:kynureninase [Bacteroidota bacterium]
MSLFPSEESQRLDAADPLASYRLRFSIPKMPDGTDTLYLCGNSLGLQSKDGIDALHAVVKDWAELGIEGYFTGDNPWVDYGTELRESEARLVGAKPLEVAVMNSLTVNLNLLLLSFYRPTPERHKIIIEDHTFPSDQYAFREQIRFHGFDPETSLVVLKPRPGEDWHRTEDILETIAKEGAETALVMMGGVNYYTGQFFDIATITKAGHDEGCTVGWDLAHAAGNLPLQLHDWNVDFAAWCHYKYLNSGPAAPGGAFVHERFAHATDLPRLAGWWGHNRSTRFQWVDEFEPEPGAVGWQMTNTPVLSTAPLKGSLTMFDELGMPAIRQKSVKLTGYLWELLSRIESGFDIMTPSDPSQRGAQLSLRVHGDNGRVVFDYIKERGVICDWRNPNCIRISPAPLYNSFDDVRRFAEIFDEALRRVG